MLESSLVELLEREKKIKAAAVLTSVFLLFVNLVLLLVLLYRFTFPTTILLPAKIDNILQVSNGKLNDSSLANYGKYFSHLLLDVTPENVDFQFASLLSYVHKDSYINTKSFLTAQSKLIAKQNLGYTFFPASYDILNKEQSVIVSGKLNSYKGASLVSSEERKIKFIFRSLYGTPYLYQISDTK